jgi:hypothetical protein
VIHEADELTTQLLILPKLQLGVSSDLTKPRTVLTVYIWAQNSVVLGQFEKPLKRFQELKLVA